jgi:hypothetical protein
MGIFGRLFGRREVIEITDDELGMMRHTRGEDTWTASIPLEHVPDDGLAHIQMRGDDEGPHPSARKDARSLKARWPDLLSGPVIEELLELEQNAADSDASRTKHDATTILEEYELVSVRLDARSERPHLEVGFNPRWSENHYVVVYLDDWERAGSSIDS